MVHLLHALQCLVYYLEFQYYVKKHAMNFTQNEQPIILVT